MSPRDPRYDVVVAGGGVAALELVLALNDLAADCVSITIVTPEVDFATHSGGWPMPSTLGSCPTPARAYITSCTRRSHSARDSSRQSLSRSPSAGRERAVIGSTHAEARDGAVLLDRTRERLAVERIVCLPLLDGPAIPGVRTDISGFIPVNADGRLPGAPDAGRYLTPYLFGRDELDGLQ